MAKKKAKIKASPILAAVAALFALVAILVMFAPAINATGDTYTGFEITFGAKRSAVVATATVLKFSFGNFVPFILAIAGLVLALLGILGKGGKLVSFIAAGLLVAAGVLFFCALPMTMPNVDSNDAADLIRKGYELAAGPIVSGIFSILAGAAMLFRVFVKK